MLRWKERKINFSYIKLEIFKNIVQEIRNKEMGDDYIDVLKRKAGIVMLILKLN